MNKKAQLTIFLILGIIVFTLFSLFFYTRAATSGLAVKLTPSFQDVEIYVTSCLKEATKEVLNKTPDYTSASDLIDPIKDNLSRCMDLSIFESYSISGINRPELDINVSGGDITVFMHYKIIVSHKDLTKEFDSFYVRIPKTP